MRKKNDRQITEPCNILLTSFNLSHKNKKRHRDAWRPPIPFHWRGLAALTAGLVLYGDYDKLLSLLMTMAFKYHIFISYNTFVL
jgi:hypothetical protein